ncbi:MAG TPA: transporter associated domain-containing protein, partial [Beijerinckiaceae bacterium]|nr:transporter associated domain-containing protein [Beijerinckiaceae bacterium]
VEVIVGDIEDEHDEAEGPLIQKAADGSFVADARASLEEASAATGADFSILTDAEDVDTLGGLVMALAGHVPVRGEIVPAGNEFELEILDADPRRVRRVRLRTHRPAPDKTAAQGPAPAAEMPLPIGDEGEPSSS